MEVYEQEVLLLILEKITKVEIKLNKFEMTLNQIEEKLEEYKQINDDILVEIAEMTGFVEPKTYEDEV